MGRRGGSRRTVDVLTPGPSWIVLAARDRGTKRSSATPLRLRRRAAPSTASRYALRPSAASGARPARRGRRSSTNAVIRMSRMRFISNRGASSASPSWGRTWAELPAADPRSRRRWAIAASGDTGSPGSGLRPSPRLPGAPSATARGRTSTSACRSGSTGQRRPSAISGRSAILRTCWGAPGRPRHRQGAARRIPPLGHKGRDPCPRRTAGMALSPRPAVDSPAPPMPECAPLRG